MKKKLLLFVLIFLTFGRFAMASSRPTPGTDEEILFERVRGNIRTLASHYNSSNKEKKEAARIAKNFIKTVLNNKKYNSYVPLAFDDVYMEDMKNLEEAKAGGDVKKISLMHRGVEDLKFVRKKLGL